ncbi:MAG: hypothetical protein IZT55_01070 [Anaerolineae bacterium]|nr:hypothetical protein [Anaerolineae bacterium]
MNKQKIVTMAMLVALIFSAGIFQLSLAAGNASPDLLEDTSVLSIINMTEEDIEIKLTPGNGDPVRLITVLSFDDDDILLKDGVNYNYEYQYCDLSNTDDLVNANIKLDGKDVELILYPCKNQPTKFVINNHMGEDASLELLYGYEEYVFDIEIGKNKVEVFSGNYIYNYDGCGTDISGDVFVKKSGKTSIILHSCEWFTDPARTYGALEPAKYKLINHASFPVILTLIGQENYLVTVNPGVNKVKLVSGSYSYSYFLDYHLVSGSMYVPVNGTGGLTLRPSFVMSNGLEDDSE